MHIVILGDSWGEPNWRGPLRPGFTETGHTANRLAALGHTVYNYSESGRSNLNTWLRLNVRPPPQADFVIWFHTEIGRDWDEQRQGFLEDMLDSEADRVYEWSSRIRAQHVGQADLIVIEGQSQLHQPHFDRYFKDCTVIRDWRAQLLGVDRLPYTPLLVMLSCYQGILDRISNSDQEKSQWIADAEQVMNLMHQSEMFPDNCHPGDLAHGLLTDQLIEIMAAKRRAQLL